MRKRLRRREWQLKRWQAELERRQNIEPVRKMKNGHLCVFVVVAVVVVVCMGFCCTSDEVT